jgi:hypothetical protein
MLRIPVVAAVALAVLLASCSAPSPDPAEPLPEQSTLPPGTSTPAPQETVAASPFVPCDEADQEALTFLYIGEYRDAPTVDFYPDFLPLPSCLLEELDSGTAIILDATQADFDALEATITAEQSAGAASDGNGVALDGVEWADQTVTGMYFLDVGFGVDGRHIAIGFER